MKHLTRNQPGGQPQGSDSMKRHSRKEGVAEMNLADLLFSGNLLHAMGRPSMRATAPLHSTWSVTPDGPVSYIMDPPEFLDDGHSGATGAGAGRKATNMKKSLVSEYWKTYAAFPEKWHWVKEARELQFAFNNQVLACSLGNTTVGMSQKQDWEINSVPHCDEYSLAFGIKPFVVMSPHKLGVRTTLSQDEGSKTGEVLCPGQCVLVDSCVVHHDVPYLRLADTSTWVFGSKDGLQVMAEIEEMESGLWWYRVACTDFVEVRRVPSFGNRFRSGCVMCPGEVVVASLRCAVGGHRFLKLADGRGWIFETTKPEADPTPDSSDPVEVMCECGDSLDHDDEEDAYESQHLSPPNHTGRRNPAVETGLWQYQLLAKPLLALGATSTGVHVGQREHIIIDKRVPANGMTAKELEGKTMHNRIWLRIADGRGWIPKTDLDGEQLVKFIGLTQDAKPAMHDLVRLEAVTSRAGGAEIWRSGIA